VRECRFPLFSLFSQEIISEGDGVFRRNPGPATARRAQEQRRFSLFCRCYSLFCGVKTSKTEDSCSRAS
jgi:hypothetical protein